MPNFDAGHYFLTVLAPIQSGAEAVGDQHVSHRYLLREVLARMPTGERTVVSQGTNPDNPFARTTRTHFARFVVLDDVVFNGRMSGNTLLASVLRTDPMVPQPVDSLSTAYLIFVADFDARSGQAAELQSYAAELWDTMHDELAAIFRHCIGFDAVTGPLEFFAYLKRCQVETTLPFNDYWSPVPTLPSFPVATYGALAFVAALFMLYAIFAGAFGLFGAGLLLLALIVFVGIRHILAAGQEPFPPSPPPSPVSDLPTVLKALYMQSAFTRLAIEAQSLRAGPNADQALHARFATFVQDTQPADISAPTQAPGVIGA